MSTLKEKVDSYNDEKSFGGPASVVVYADMGKRGSRGTNFFLPKGNPNSSPSTMINQTGDMETPQKYDIAIDLDTASSTYLDLFYYNDSTGSLTWENKLGLIPTSFPRILDSATSPQPTNSSITPFNEQGQSLISLTFPLSAELSTALPTLTPEDFVIFDNVINDNPISSTIGLYPPGNPAQQIVVNYSGPIPVSLTVNIYIIAMQYLLEYGAWAPVTGNRRVHLFLGLKTQA